MVTAGSVEWEAFVAADEELRRRLDRLRAVDYGSALRSGLRRGGLRSAVPFVTEHRPMEFINANLDVLLPLAVEGGLEQRDVVDLLRTVDRDVLADALPAFVARTLAVPGQEELVYPGLLELLVMLDRRDLLRPVVEAAERSEEADAREAGAEHRPLAGGSGANLPPATAIPKDPPVSAEVAEAWASYEHASVERSRSRYYLTHQDDGAVLLTGLRGEVDAAVAARLLSESLRWFSKSPAADLATVLRGMSAPRRSELLDGLERVFFEDHRDALERFRVLADMLGALDEQNRLDRVARNAMLSPDPRVRLLAESLTTGTTHG